MKHHLAKSLLLAGAAVVSLPALAQMAQGARDPYSQGAAAPDARDPYTQGAATNTGTGLTDPYAGGARAPDKFDPYTQGANQPTRQDLAPAQSEPMDGSQAYMDRSRWLGPSLGTRTGMRNPFLDGT
ncbi:endonuclease [Cupriavidus basilensis]|uniref:endonuclease n=1 Tax=Cupriavidus basilensis TaxID=68895 RepID=UPI00284C27AF|nr:endonuclease [Cupriavidus basilensis]MDR3380157.1 endonuclease [Cupriavidus basilensis]